MKKKDKLFLLMSLNAAISVGAYSNSALEAKYERLYNKMIKNIETGKSNNENYSLIEKVLNDRNKELKDLYLQGDYVVKPEYLEWQIFFSGFYTENNKGDNTSENALYHSDPSYNNGGYYDTNGEFVVTSFGGNETRGKEYRPPQIPKDIDLGVSIPIKGLTRVPTASNPALPGEVDVNPGIANVTQPQSLNVPVVTPLIFQPITPAVESPILTSVPVITVKGAGGGNSDGAYFIQGGSSHAVISQWDMITGDIDIVATAFTNYSYSMNNATGTISMSGQRVSPGSLSPGTPYTSAALPSTLINQPDVFQQGSASANADDE